jgi:hypothetical protein
MVVGSDRPVARLPRMAKHLGAKGIQCCRITFRVLRSPESRPQGRRRGFHRLSRRLTTPPAVASGVAAPRKTGVMRRKKHGGSRETPTTRFVAEDAAHSLASAHD